jgi:2-polyprenyl-3-methyl-5-hydroxy-6-metoxy-1,4-benzoquinol methylase
MITPEEEAAKYKKIWEHDDYRKWSPAEHFCKLMPDVPPGRLIDWGAGTGRQALAFHNRGFQVTMVDIAHNCLDEDVKKVIGDRLVVQNLWDPVKKPPFEYGICCDVMEHLPPEYVVHALKNIIQHAPYTFFSICNTDDHFGQVIGEKLHLTVKPFAWWKNLLDTLSVVENARDLGNDSIFWVKKRV